MQEEVKNHILKIIEDSEKESTKWISELDPEKDYTKEEKSLLAFKKGFNTYAQALLDIRYFINDLSR